MAKGKDSKYRQELGLRLAICREKKFGKHHGASSECAEALGISRQYWSEIEKGRRVLGTDRVALLVEFFGCDALWLLTGKKSDDFVEQPSSDLLTSLAAAPVDCPNGGLCARLARLVILQRAMISDSVLGGGMDLGDLEAAMIAVSRRQTLRLKEKAMASISPAKDGIA